MSILVGQAIVREYANSLFFEAGRSVAMPRPSSDDAYGVVTWGVKKERLRRILGEHVTGAILDSLACHLAILDERGVIRYTNRAWREYGMANDIKAPPDCIGLNYLEICDCAEGSSTENAREAAAGIRAVIGGDSVDFALDYPCHSADRKRWFHLRATRIMAPERNHVVVTHDDITHLKLVEESLLERETALKVLLNRRDEDKRELADRIVLNTQELVVPYIEKLKTTCLDTQQEAYVEILESHVNEILSPFLRRLSAQRPDFTPQELKVAQLVKDGKATKEIADILITSKDAIDFHRKNIRKKLGLRNRKVNLRSYLLSLEPNS
jgi:DNA-binding CsgD family transcriptional regulator